MLMNLSKSTPMPPNSVNYGFQPMSMVFIIIVICSYTRSRNACDGIARHNGSFKSSIVDHVVNHIMSSNQEGTPSEWNRPSPVTPSTKYRSTVKVIPTPDPIKSSRMATYAFSFEELEMKESMDSLYIRLLRFPL